MKIEFHIENKQENVEAIVSVNKDYIPVFLHILRTFYEVYKQMDKIVFPDTIVPSCIGSNLNIFLDEKLFIFSNDENFSLKKINLSIDHHEYFSNNCLFLIFKFENKHGEKLESKFNIDFLVNSEKNVHPLQKYIITD